MKKITRKTNIMKLTQEYPELAELLSCKYGFHCIGCMAAAFETLEQGAMAHGITDKKIDEMIEELNEKKRK